MRKIILIFTVLFVANAVDAQTKNERLFKPFNVNNSTGISLPIGGGDLAKGGVLFAAGSRCDFTGYCS